MPRESSLSVADGGVFGSAFGCIRIEHANAPCEIVV
jgi:hypothetical protein